MALCGKMSLTDQRIKFKGPFSALSAKDSHSLPYSLSLSLLSTCIHSHTFFHSLNKFDNKL